MTAHPKLDDLLSRLHSVTREAKGWLACCPAHGDRNPSLIVGVGDSGNIVLHCRSRHCSTEAIVASIGMEMKDLMPPRVEEAPKELAWDDRIEATYDFHDERGQVLYQEVRLHSPKDFKLRRPSGARLGAGDVRETVWNWKVPSSVRRVPFALPKLVAAPAGAWLIVVEGSKKAKALCDLGLLATTNAGGAGKWGGLDGDAVRSAFAGKRVAILPDNDVAGWQHALQVAIDLAAKAVEVRVVELPGLGLKGDVVNWLEKEKAS